MIASRYVRTPLRSLCLSQRLSVSLSLSRCLVPTLGCRRVGAIGQSQVLDIAEQVVQDIDNFG
eukprot:1384489-Prorocentrum_lima.AAC.1